MPTVVVVEDDRAILEGLQATLTAEGFEVRTASRGPEGFQRARQPDVDVIVLDVMLPGMSGLEITKRLRDGGSRVPILLLTARGEEEDRVLGLELGADDYVTKPFSVRELLARIRSILRRTRGGTPAAATREFRFGDVRVDYPRRRVEKGGRRLEISDREFRLLEYFIAHAGETVTRAQLLNEVWGYEAYPTTRTVDNHVARLRKKIEDEPDRPRYILTVRGAGYLFEPEGDEASRDAATTARDP